jgi:recombination protein RecA
MATSFDRDKALDVALAQIDKQHGKGAVMRLGDRVSAPIEVIPTGSIALDVALGIGGLPRGRVIEIYGPESSGKTTVALPAASTPTPCWSASPTPGSRRSRSPTC